ncbi:MAG: Stf0 family sulfotransferase [Bacteroidota bacterium]
MKPIISYTIWFSQRNGSSLLCEALASTGIAGKPGEHFLMPANASLFDFYKVNSYEELQEKLWQTGMTANGVFGIKTQAPKRINDPLIDELTKFPGIEKSHPANYEVWANAFPNGKHIFLTRRNKVRQAVSWWKAIITEEWHRESGKSRPYSAHDIRDRYDFNAIRHLLLEANFLENRTQDFFDGGNIVPLTIVYEDLIREYEETVRGINKFLGISETSYSVAQPYYEQLADEVSDDWTERFRVEMQKDWHKNIW